MQAAESITRVHIQLSESTLQFVFLSPQNQIQSSGIISLQNYDDRQWETLLSSKPWDLVYDKPLTVFIYNAWFTIIPLAFFDEAQKKSSLELVTGPLKMYNIVSKPLLSNVYLQAVPEFFERFLTARFKHIHWIGAPEFYYNFLSTKSTQHMALTLSWHNNLLMVSAVYQQQMVFCNSYPAKTQTEIMYFVLFVKQRVLPSYTLGSIYIFGNTLKDLQQQIEHYFNKVEWHVVTSPMVFASPNNDQNLSIELLNLSICAS